MSYVDVEVAEGRRCAGEIAEMAAKLDAFVEGESCELCHMLDTLASNLKVLANDLSEASNAYEKEADSDGKAAE